MLKLSCAWLCGLSSVPQGSGLSRLRSSVSLLHSLLANVSMPWAGNGALWRPWYDGGRHGDREFTVPEKVLLCFVWVLNRNYFHVAKLLNKQFLPSVEDTWIHFVTWLFFIPHSRLWLCGSKQKLNLIIFSINIRNFLTVYTSHCCSWQASSKNAIKNDNCSDRSHTYLCTHLTELPLNSHSSDWNPAIRIIACYIPLFGEEFDVGVLSLTCNIPMHPATHFNHPPCLYDDELQETLRQKGKLYSAWLPP